MEPDYRPTIVDVLGMAREMLLDKYTESKEYYILCWKLSNGTMSTPEMCVYPTEEEIITLARKLWIFFKEDIGNVYVGPTPNVGNVHTTTTETNWQPMPNVSNVFIETTTVI